MGAPRPTVVLAPSSDDHHYAIAAYLGSGTSFDRAILEFSNAYVEQNERDYQHLTAAVAAGTLVAQTGL